MKRNISLFILLIFTALIPILAQNNNLEITGRIETPDGIAIAGATAEIFDGNTKIKTANSGLNGEISFTLEYGKSYKVYITRSGMIKKRLDFETNIPAEEQRKLFKEFAMTLVEDCEGTNLSVFEEPIDKIEYDFGIRNFTSDKTTYNQMSARVSAAYAELEQCKQNKFQDKKEAADLASKQGNYEEAKKLYQEALQFYPNDANIKRLIGQTQKNIEQQSSNKTKYEQLIKEGDQFLSQNQLTAAKQRYTEAARLNPTETYPAEKIKEIDATSAKQAEQLKQQQESSKQYNDILGQANAAMASKNYPMAKQLYEQAAQLKPSEAFPTQKAAEAQQAMAKIEEDKKQAEANDKAYQDAMALGQQALEKGDYKAAQQYFLSATPYKPNEVLPRQKVAEAQKMEEQKKQDELKAQRAELMKKFEEKVQSADEMLARNEYDNAITAYKQALEFVPTDAYCQSQVVKAQNQKVEVLKKQSVEIEKTYSDAINLGDSKKTAMDFEGALTAYQNALTAKPNDPVALARIREAQKLLTDQQTRAKQEQEIKARYSQLIQEADNYFKAQDYENAKNSYKQAAGLIPSQAYPSNQIAAIDNILSKAALESQYNQLIAEADKYLANSDFTNAIKQYNAASVLIPDKTYPRQKLNEISRLQNEKSRKDLQDKYDALAKQAEEQISQKNYEEAKKLYSQATLVMPENDYPAKRINEINGMISAEASNAIRQKYDALAAQAEQMVTQQNFEEAKKLYMQAQTVMPENTYPQKRINEINILITEQSKKSVRDKYNALTAQAEEQVTAQNYEEAKKLYTQASQVIPEEDFPKKRINEINQLISDKARKEIEEKYNTLIKQADAEITSKNYTQARALYTQAQLVMPDNPYPQKRINEINDLLTQQSKSAIREKYNTLTTQAEEQINRQNFEEAKKLYAQASEVIPEEEYPKKRINEINAMISDKARKEAEEKYNALIQQADAEINSKNYAQARTLYTQAQLIMPDNPYPQKRINEINDLISKQAKQAVQEKYDALAAQAEEQINQKNYEEAKRLYLQASQVMPENTYPQKRINEINALIDSDSKAAYEKKYSDMVAEADGYFNQQQYEQAKAAYGRIQKEFPEKTYAAQRINEINQLLSDLAKKETATKYNAAVAEGDRYFSEQNYELAKKSYLLALQISPDQIYPQQKINEISSILANAAKIENDKAEKKSRYDKTLALADAYFNEQNYVLARQEYTNAQTIFPEEAYPSSQITKIDQLVEEQKRKEAEMLEQEKKFNSLIARADELFKAKSYIDAKQIYQEALIIKPKHPQATSQIKRIDDILAAQAADLQKLNETNNSYNSLISQADEKYNANSLAEARKLYYASLQVKPNEEYPKSQIRKIDEKVKQTVVTTTTKTGPTDNSSKLSDLTFKTESERAKYLEELKKNYPAGVTVETYREKNRTINRYIVIRGTEVHELREISYSYGVTECSIDGKPTNAMYLQSFVKPKQGENLSKVEK